MMEPDWRRDERTGVKMYRHIDNVQVEADFACEQGVRYRYRLEITKHGASRSPKTACVVMQNPSCAGKDIADRSVEFLEKVVFEKQQQAFDGVERLLIVNQFARVQTKTSAKFGCDSDIGEKNNEAIKSALEEAQVVVIAWGKSNKFKERQKYVCALLKPMTDKQLYRTRYHPAARKSCSERSILCPLPSK